MLRGWEFKVPQKYTTGGRKYDVHTAIRYAEGLPVKKVDLSTLYLYYAAPCSDDLLSFVDHMRQSLNADKTKPIIMNELGVIIDGRHRLSKALLDGDKTIPVVKFETDPPEIYEVIDE